MRLGLDHHRLLELTRTGEGVIRVGSRSRPTFILNHPDHVRRVLVDRRENYDKTTFLNDSVIRAVTGESLLNSNGPEWERQRQAAQRLLGAAAGSACVDVVSREALRWMDGWDSLGDGAEVWTLAEMSRLVLRITGRLIFQSDLAPHEDAVIGGLDTVVARLRPLDPEFQRAVADVRRVATRILEDARGADGPFGAWVQERTREAEGTPGADIVGETVALLLTSYETTAIALAWTLLLLSRHPEARRRIEEEIDRTLAGAPARAEHLPRLTYVRATIDESMRLYPPAWSLMRRAVAQDEIGGVTIPTESMVAMYPYTLHRHPAFWDRPEAFEPERFFADRAAARPQFAYIPFGAGARACIGARLALLELPALLAAMVQRWRLDLSPGQSVALEARINLRPKGDFRMRLERRARGG